MTKPTSLPLGVATESAGPMAEFGSPSPFKWHSYFNDFEAYEASDWVVTEVELGTGAAAQTSPNEDGGILLLTNDDANDDATFLQLPNETFALKAGKKALFAIRCKFSNATQADFTAGLQNLDTTPLTSSDGIYFRSNGGDVELDTQIRAASVGTMGTNIATLADDTYAELGFLYDGKDTVAFYVDKAQVAKDVATNVPLAQALTVSFGIQNGNATANSMSIDYVFAAVER